MSPCSGTSQIIKFDAILYWRNQPDVERRVVFSATGVDGVWDGEGSTSNDLGDAQSSNCGERRIYGSAVVLRVKLHLECTETSTKTYVKGQLIITFGTTTFKVKLLPKELICVTALKSSVEWPMLFLQQLGSGHLVITSSTP